MAITLLLLVVLGAIFLKGFREATLRTGSRVWMLAFGLVTVVFIYALVANEIQRPDGLIISSFFIAAMVFTSLVSRVYRSLELRQECIVLDETAQRLIDEVSHKGEIHLVANRRPLSSSSRSRWRTPRSSRTSWR